MMMLGNVLARTIEYQKRNNTDTVKKSEVESISFHAFDLDFGLVTFKGEIKRTTSVQFRRKPDFSTQVFNEFFGHRQTKTRSLFTTRAILTFALRPGEGDFLNLIAHRRSRVFDANLNFIMVQYRRNMNGSVLGKFICIQNQISENKLHHVPIGENFNIVDVVDYLVLFFSERIFVVSNDLPANFL